MYIHELEDWPRFLWNDDALIAPLADVRYRQGYLLGGMKNLGFELRQTAVLDTLTADVLNTSEIEGEKLNVAQVRSSVARRLGIEIGGLVAADRHIDGVVEMVLDATNHYEQPLTAERLYGWHAALFPTGYSGMSRVITARWREDRTGPMQVVSGRLGREGVHFEAPAATRVDTEMSRFLEWFESQDPIDPVLKAALAHLWFVTIHPFDDGNGRIARAIADLALSRSEATTQRFYSMSSQIRRERDAYYAVLERTQKGTLDITAWMDWFVGCLSRAITGAEAALTSILAKARFWERAQRVTLNDRQHKVLNRLLDGFEGKLTTSKYATLAKCSQDTALRDILSLVDAGLLVRNPEGGRSTSYALVTA